MSSPTSSANIKFPATATTDEKIRNLLEEEGVRFKETGDLGDPLYDLDVEVEDGIFSLQNETAYGEFGDLEDLLIEKGIPFDRTSNMDWNCPPRLRVFRPGAFDRPNYDHIYSLDADGYEPVVSVVKIRELLSLPMPTHEIQVYLEKHFPAYPPLTDWVKEDS